MLVMIDNYDSFTFNVVRYFRELEQDVQVFRNDAISIAQLRLLQPAGIILSPGPCTPDEAGVSLEVVRELAGEVPILGVCLGHQTIAQAFGAKVVRAPPNYAWQNISISPSAAGVICRIAEAV